ncbi:MAG: iron-sulfur cluster assembly protein [Flavobacteriales bacterium]
MPLPSSRTRLSLSFGSWTRRRPTWSPHGHPGRSPRGLETHPAAPAAALDLPPVMASITKDAVLSALSRIIEPDLKKDIVALDLVRDIKITGNTLSVHVEVSNPAMHSRKRMEEAVTFNLQQAFGKDVAIMANVTALER